MNSKTLTQASIDYLAERQAEIDPLPTPQEQAEKAIDLWGRKSRAYFDAIKKELLAMCVGVEICVYCENNEATDVEHIYPKKIFPKKAFLWENYVLACGKCNSHHKSDKFRIFNPHSSATIQDVTPPRGKYSIPANDDAVFINQRADNPLDFIELDLLNQTFIFTEIAAPGTREHERAKFTIELLGLNTRGSLIAARKRAAASYLYTLAMYVKARSSADYDALTAAVDDFEKVDTTQNFETEKRKVLGSIKKRIFESDHPTVWKELIRQRHKLTKTKALLADAPEALDW